jgi:hypothetical protein
MLLPPSGLDFGKNPVLKAGGPLNPVAGNVGQIFFQQVIEIGPEFMQFKSGAA